MKMANMDSAFDFMFTSPKDATGVSSLVVFFNNYLEIFETPREKKNCETLFKVLFKFKLTNSVS